MGAIDRAVVDYILFNECYKHGPKDPCPGQVVATSKQGNKIECDTSIPHCPECGRRLNRTF